MKNFINGNKILDLLETTKRPSNYHVEKLFEKSLRLNGLSPEDAAVLLNCEDEVVLNNIFTVARQIKEYYIIHGDELNFDEKSASYLYLRNHECKLKSEDTLKVANFISFGVCVMTFCPKTHHKVAVTENAYVVNRYESYFPTIYYIHCSEVCKAAVFSCRVLSS